jgi:predicted metal-dependent phosphoesterase TrpH
MVQGGAKAATQEQQRLRAQQQAIELKHLSDGELRRDRGDAHENIDRANFHNGHVLHILQSLLDFYDYLRRELEHAEFVEPPSHQGAMRGQLTVAVMSKPLRAAVQRFQACLPRIWRTPRDNRYK